MVNIVSNDFDIFVEIIYTYIYVYLFRYIYIDIFFYIFRVVLGSQQNLDKGAAISYIRLIPTHAYPPLSISPTRIVQFLQLMNLH